MSTRCYLKLTNTKTNESNTIQLFGNNCYYEIFHDYIIKNNPDLEVDEEYSFENANIPDVKTLIQAIDTSIYNEVIKPTIKENKIKNYGYYSASLDFSERLISLEGEPITTLFSVASTIMNYAYLTTSYNVYSWLKENDAIQNIEYLMINHDYLKHNDYVKLGELKENFKLTLSRF